MIRRWYWSRSRLTSEYDALVQEIASLKEQNGLLERALLFYSKEENYPAYYAGPASTVQDDKGLIARTVLECVWGKQAILATLKQLATRLW